MTEDEQPTEQALVLDRPILVWVTDGGDGGSDKLSDVVFKKENLALGMKAFRTVTMRPEDASKDPIFQGKGSETPRILLVGADKEVTVLEKGKLTSGGVWSAMRKVAGAFYAQDLEDVVKAHLKLLTEIDKSSAEAQLLADKAARLDSDKDKAQIEKVQKETDAVKARLEELMQKQSDLWKLTAKGARQAA
jgi:hypothetical protein